MLLRCGCDAGDLNMSKENCQRHGGRGRWEGTGAGLKGHSPAGRSSSRGCCETPGCQSGGKGENWLPFLCVTAVLLASHPSVPGLARVMHLAREQRGQRRSGPSCGVGQGGTLAPREGPSQPGMGRGYTTCPALQVCLPNPSRMGK